MGKLNIAHHKSYHPYRLDNIERVRKDEEQAKLKEEGEEGRIRVADSEARLDLLRGRAGGSKRVKNKEGEDTQAQSQALPALTSISTSSGHINLFADFEQHATSNALIRTRELTTKGTQPEDEKGVRLAPSAKDLKPWYVNSESQTEEMPEDKRMKDLSSKSTFDPLTSIKSQLSLSYPPTSLTQSSSFATRRTQTQAPSNPTDARLHRESSERTRAMELIRRKKRERERASLGMGNLTPSTAGGGGGGGGGGDEFELDRSAGYGDVYNRKETEDAQRRRERERERDRGWGREYRWERRGSEYRGRRW